MGQTAHTRLKRSRKRRGAMRLVVFLMLTVLLACSAEQLDPEPTEEITCGSGFGLPTAVVGISAEVPVWSMGWEQALPNRDSAWTDLPDGTQETQIKAPVSVMAGVGATVRILSPDSARIVITTEAVWSTGEGIDSLRTKEVSLPVCPDEDTYPGIIVITQPECVLLEVSSTTVDPYTVEIC